MKTKKVATAKGTPGFSLLDAFLKTIKLDKDETAIDITQNPEKLVGFTGWKKIKLVNNPEKEAYFYFKKGIPSASLDSFTKEFAKNLANLVDKKKFKKNLSDFLYLDNCEVLFSDESTEIIVDTLTSNENISEISFTKDGKIAFYADEYADFGGKKLLSVDKTDSTHEFIEKLFEKEEIKKTEKETKGKIVEVKSYDELSLKSNFTGVLKVPQEKSWNYSDYKELHFYNGEYHRLNGPAIELHDGTKEWYKEGLRHRTDGPAIERTNGRKEWWAEGNRHRLDGPAIEYQNGDKFWYIEGKSFSQEKEFKAAAKQYLELEKQLKETKAKLNSKLNSPKDTKPVSEKNTNTKSKEVVKENSTKELPVIANFPSLKEVPETFSGKATVGGVSCHFTNGLLHNEIGPAVESELVERNYSINGMVMTKTEFLNFKEFETRHRQYTPEFLLNTLKATKSVEKIKLNGLPEFEVDIYSVGNKDWCFSPQLINGKFSDRKILTSIELYDKDGLSHSRQAPAIIDRFKGNIYCINGMMYPSSKEWSKAINGEFKELKKLYREAIVFEDLIKSLEHVKKYSENELFKNEVGTGYVLRTKTIGSEKFDRIIILKDGNYRAEFVFVDGVLEAFVRFNDSALFHADNGPTIMDNISGKYDLETFPCFYVNGKYLSIDEYEKKYGFEHPSKIIKDLLSEINVVPKKKEEEETSITKEVVEKTAIKTVINTIKSDSREVAKRLAAKKISDFSQNMLITILETAAAKNKNFEKLKDFLKSSKGNILIKFFSGISIDLLKDKLDPKYKDLLLEIASEFRIQSETDLSIEIIDLVQGLVSNIDILSNLSFFEEKIRVQVSNFETLPSPTQELEIESNNISSAKYVN